MLRSRLPCAWCYKTTSSHFVLVFFFLSVDGKWMFVVFFSDSVLQQAHMLLIGISVSL